MGLVGLLVIVLITAFTGITEEHRIGNAFKDALPFTALLVVFFAVVAVIHDQQLFTPLIQWVLALPAEQQPGMLFIANGLLSAISDNVFVATIYITEVKQAFVSGHMSREHFETLAIAINTGTNLPSVATPTARQLSCFADLCDCAADPPVLRADGVDGATVHRGDGRAGLVRGQLLAVKDKPFNSLGCAVLEIAAGDDIGLALDGLFGLAHGNR